jgi:hypothetical protein
MVVFALKFPSSAMTLSVDDFKIHRAICEIRYEDAHLLFDHTGRTLQNMKSAFTDLKVTSAAPNQTTGRCKEGAFALELAASRFSAENPDSKLEAFGVRCKNFFEIVIDSLELKVFTRIGLRVLYRADTTDLDKARKKLNELELVNRPSELRYEASEEPEELILRWQNDEVGTMLRLKAEKGTVDVVLPPELEMEKSSISKSYVGLVLDVDTYTVAPVERSQWDASSWIQQSIRIVRRDTNKILAR